MIPKYQMKLFIVFSIGEKNIKPVTNVDLTIHIIPLTWGGELNSLLIKNENYDMSELSWRPKKNALV